MEQAKTWWEKVVLVGDLKDENYWQMFIKQTIAIGIDCSKNFQAGKLRNHIDFWKSLTTDRNIIYLIMGTKIELKQAIFQKE